MSDKSNSDPLASFLSNHRQDHKDDLESMLEARKKKLRQYMRDAKTAQTKMEMIKLREQRLKDAKGG